MKIAELTTSQKIDGKLRLSKGYRELDGVDRIDLIQDYIGLLTELHKMEMADVWGHDYEPHKVCRDDIYGWETSGTGRRLKDGGAA
jgi:hypothetical protein